MPTLETDRLILRLFRETDLDAYSEMCADPDVMRYIGVGQPLSRSEAWRNMAMILGHWQLRGYGLWAVVEKYWCMGYTDKTGPRINGAFAELEIAVAARNLRFGLDSVAAVKLLLSSTVPNHRPNTTDEIHQFLRSSASEFRWVLTNRLDAELQLDQSNW